MAGVGEWQPSAGLSIECGLKVGFGDEIMATGMARGAKARGKRIAFGDGRQIIFSPWSEQMFRFNPNIARPGDERSTDIEWIAHHKGNRLYNKVNADRTRWVWNMAFRPVHGELFFSETELKFAAAQGAGFVVIEPNVPWHKSVAKNKDWGLARYQAVADNLRHTGHRAVQFGVGQFRLTGVDVVHAPDFRKALATLERASLYIGPEGGLHHGAAAVGIPAVVLFGGWIPSQVTGYDSHTNITAGDGRACGRLQACRHCKEAMAAIGVDRVVSAAQGYLEAKAA